MRVGGITADWLRYVLDDSPAGAPASASASLADMAASPSLRGFWPTAPTNVSLAQFYNLTRFVNESGLSLLFDLNELFGRDCNTTKPGCASCGDWCGSPPTYPLWDTSNARACLQRLHDDGTAGGPANALYAFELGNELAGHVLATENTADILALSQMVGEIWADAPAALRPQFFAPSTDNCASPDTAAIMHNVTHAVTGFSSCSSS